MERSTMAELGRVHDQDILLPRIFYIWLSAPILFFLELHNDYVIALNSQEAYHLEASLLNLYFFPKILPNLRLWP